jgi:hypothetical protein
MERQRNTALEALLTEVGYTHQELADEVNRVAEDRFGTPANCTDRHVRRWISGEVQWPWCRYLLPLQEIFGRSPEAMGFVPRKSVVEKVRGTGAARQIHDELLRGRPEERVTLLVERDHPKVRALYEAWGYEWFGELLPFPDAPLYDAMVLDLH